MAVGYWILLLLVAAVAAGLAGFAVGRASAPGERKLRELTRARDAAQAEAEQVRNEVDRHFEESARMFGRLAADYRAFFEQFAQTAQNLGMSEARARGLLRRADPHLIEGDRGDPAGTAAGSPASAGEGTAGGQHPGSAEGGVAGEADAADDAGAAGEGPQPSTAEPPRRREGD